MEQDILKRNIVDGKTAWWLKELGYKGWCSGYYHDSQYEECEGEDALEYYEYECIGGRSGFVNENSDIRAAAPTLVEAWQFLVDNNYSISISYCGYVVATLVKDGVFRFVGKSVDEALEKVFAQLTETV